MQPLIPVGLWPGERVTGPACFAYSHCKRKGFNPPALPASAKPGDERCGPGQPAGARCFHAIVCLLIRQTMPQRLHLYINPNFLALCGFFPLQWEKEKHQRERGEKRVGSDKNFWTGGWVFVSFLSRVMEYPETEH